MNKDTLQLAIDMAAALKKAIPVLGAYESEHESNWALDAVCDARSALDAWTEHFTTPAGAEGRDDG